jgi:sugar lactone lactonase YvrE
MHVIPDLKRLEAKYPDELVVIGVHSAKFTNEKDSDNIRQAILRYGIEHPVVNDSQFRIWRSYGVRAWPTLILINPEGYVAGVVSGEGHYELLDEAISALIAEFSEKGKMDKTPLVLALEKHKELDTILSFPGKVLVSSDRLFISDSNHNRIVIADLDGNVTDIIGSGEAGASDGNFEEATFDKPQGMSLDGKYLYVADTENHLIRRCHLETRMVETIAGTGQQARGAGSGGKARQTPLSSPWDVIVIVDKLYIAMAGTHQIWVMDFKEDHIQPYAGSGHEGRVDDSLMKSALAQPSGITTDGKRLFIADSETSSIRSVDLDEDGKVETIVGLALFDFGDKDGKGREVRLQHPLDVLFHEGMLYVADTYNHKIKIIDPQKKTSETFLGTGRPGDDDGISPGFYEPGGLAFFGNKLYIADTNNHVIRVVDLSTKIVHTLALKGFTPPGEEETGFPAEAVVFPGRRIRAGGNGELILNVTLPPSYKLTEGAPLEYEIKPCERELLKFSESDRKGLAPELPVNIPFRASDEVGSCQMKIKLMFNYCKEDTGICFIKFLTIHIPIQISKDDKNQRIFVEYKVSP